MVEKEIALEGLILIKPKIFPDHRGEFFESYNTDRLNNLIGEKPFFFQDNISVSKKNVLRGLHFQRSPMAQAKLIQVFRGGILDVVVDLRLNSATYGQHYKVELNDQNRFQLWIPQGFAHGFLTLEDNTIFSYKCTSAYSKNHEMNLLWNDPLLNIDWGITSPLLSEKDKLGQPFENFDSPFK